MSRQSLKGFIDIGANLVDSMFSGTYNGSQKHAPDLDSVLQRSWNNGLKKIIITGTSLNESKAAVELAQKDDKLFSTVGCHPTNCNEIDKANDKNSYFKSLIELYKRNKDKVVALGEFGLDYDRLHFCSKETQLKYFEEQLIAFEEIKLPLFLHCRNAADDLLNILTKHRDKFVGGVVHSFDGSQEDAKKIIDLGLYIGINGCSLRTDENLSVVKHIPSDKLLIETDSPWCEIKASHAGFKYVHTKFPSVKKEKWESDKLIKGRNEPCNIIQVLEILSGVREEDLISLGDTIFENTRKLFFSDPRQDYIHILFNPHYVPSWLLQLQAKINSFNGYKERDRDYSLMQCQEMGMRKNEGGPKNGEQGTIPSVVDQGDAILVHKRTEDTSLDLKK